MSKTITVAYEVFDYNELTEEAKKNVKDWILKDESRCYEFETMMNENLRSFFDANLKVQFSLSYCQGDGFNIYGEVSAKNILNYLNNHYTNTQSECLTEKEMKTIIAYQSVCSDIKLDYNRRYSYSLADRIDIAGKWFDELQYAGYKNINVDVLSKFERLVRNIFLTLCKTYENDGYAYFYTISDEEVEELCDANKWEFDINGMLFVA